MNTIKAKGNENTMEVPVSTIKSVDAQAAGAGIRVSDAPGRVRCFMSLLIRDTLLKSRNNRTYSSLYPPKYLFA